MEQAFLIFIVLGVVIVGLVLILIGIFVGGRSRRASSDDVDSAPASLPVVPADTETPSPSLSQPVQIYLEGDGSASVEIEGRRFNRLSEIGDERLLQRALAAVGALQRFAGIAPVPFETGRVDDLRVGHTQDSGALIVEFKGERYRRLADIRDGETGRQLLALIGELNIFAQGMIVRPAKSGEQARQVEEEFLKQLARPMSEPASLKIPGLIESLRRPVPKPEPMPVGIAGQIERVLQQQLALDPIWQGHSVHVVTAKDGSLNVEDKGQLFHWPDAVTDPLVREAVQKAIRLWEREAG